MLPGAPATARGSLRMRGSPGSSFAGARVTRTCARSSSTRGTGNAGSRRVALLLDPDPGRLDDRSPLLDFGFDVGLGLRLRQVQHPAAAILEAGDDVRHGHRLV